MADEWEYGVDEVESGGEDEVPEPPIEPESPSTEGIAFFLMGALFALFVIVRLFLG